MSTRSEGEPLLALCGVTKRFAGAEVIKATSLSIARGEAVALIGPSGSGKSTLLRLMNGLLAPDTGEVRLEGRAPDARGWREARRRQGFVIQGGGLFPHLSAAENVTLMARHLGWSGAKIAARLEELAALTRFPRDALARRPLELSGGQRQRVALMRALVLDPELLLLDEPLGALDPLIRRDLQEELGGLVRSLGKAVVLVTHDLSEAAFLAARLVLLREGSIVQDGSLAGFVERPADPFVTRFVRAQRPLVAALAERA